MIQNFKKNLIFLNKILKYILEIKIECVDVLKMTSFLSCFKLQ